VRFPAVGEAHYIKFEQPASRFALTGVAVARSPSGVRVAVTGLGNGIWRWRAAEQALADDFAAGVLQGLCVDPAEASGDIHASAQYRAHLAGVLTRRAVQHILKSSA
jgi:carbon-monoxide dehydrogenase medium subunit